MITHLMLENWRSHEATEFVFAKGTNVLVGPMGSGKSSVLDGICFALFGTFPNLQQRRVRLDDMVMNKPASKEKAKVLLSFRAGDKEYSVKREVLRGKGGSAELREAGRLVEGPQSQRVTDRVCELLGMNYDLFSRAVYSEQNAIDYFLEIPKGQRKQKIDELLAIDRFERARKSLGTVITRLTDKREEKEAAAVAAKEVGQIPALEKEIAEKRAELDRKEAGRAALETRRAAAYDAYSAASNKRAEFQRLDRLVKENSGKAGTLRERLARAERPKEDRAAAGSRLAALEKERAEVKRKEDEKNSLKQRVSELSASISEKENTLVKADQALAALAAFEEAPRQEQEFRKRIEDKAAEIESLRDDIKENDVRIHEIEESEAALAGKDRCPVCDAKLEPEKREELLRSRKDEKAERTKKLEEFRRRLEALASERKGLEAKRYDAEQKMFALKQKDQASRMREQLASETEDKKRELEQTKAKLSSIVIEKSMEDIEKESRRLEKALEWYSLEDEAKAAEAAIASCRDGMARLGYDEAVEKKAYDEFKEAEKALAVAAEEARAAGDLVAEKGKRLAELVRIKEEVELNRQVAAYLVNATGSLQMLQSTLQEAQAVLRQEFAETTNAALVDVWEKLYPYKDYTRLRLGIDESGDYILQLKRRDGAWVNVEGITSGGERSTACLSLRIALALVLAPNLSWLVLDEPTHNLDRQGIKELSKTLREYLPCIVEQVFIITHEEELENAASGYLYRLERNKETDEPTRIAAESSAT